MKSAENTVLWIAMLSIWNLLIVKRKKFLISLFFKIGKNRSHIFIENLLKTSQHLAQGTHGVYRICTIPNAQLAFPSPPPAFHLLKSLFGSASIIHISARSCTYVMNEWLFFLAFLHFVSTKRTEWLEQERVKAKTEIRQSAKNILRGHPAAEWERETEQIGKFIIHLGECV